MPYKFWNTESWQKDFKTEIIKAAKLLQTYSDIAILKAIDEPWHKWMYSLLPAKLKTSLEKQQKIYEEETASKEAAVIKEVDITTRKPSKPIGEGKNLMGEL